MITDIKKARNKAGLTQKEVAKAMECTEQTYAKMERNPAKTKVSTLKRIAKALNVKINVFFID